jgi:uncharacterized protein with HEPN domain
MNRRDKSIILHVLDTSDEINEYLQNIDSFETYKSNTLIRRATTMCMISIAELVSHFSDEFRSEYSEVNITQFKQLRNIAAHNYGAISVTKLYDTLTLELPAFRSQLESISKKV